MGVGKNIKLYGTLYTPDCRARVVGFINNSVQVELLDSGETKYCDRIYGIHSQFLLQPFYGIQAKLEDATKKGKNNILVFTTVLLL